ncbi:hypothetical protein COU15_02355 [Candidatus Kaiserbacteria bacterium CG10_big_fil_rev_8_21_14_0_10_45_20]|uniref:Capsule synthesis protein CapA domain-containing protein n=1 Tax=Candidatus Kaiserbacteria bacterium CG10_big_fil_rev_8_21_14_0_10_45_20 TaxID=1974607 RepID=A0A2H0UFS2_9BACT|nr:MAG: hypothetical protein COU15_02355 [Candidatus Kaiserbacteria bacterium CG10_big_fil_rev_8_21_14_0_10_45_20]
MKRTLIGIAVLIFLFSLPLQFQYLFQDDEVTALQSQETVVDEPLSILFVGDMMFDRYIRKVADVATGDFILSCIVNELMDADFVVGNLEGPITTNESVSVNSTVGGPNNYTFTFPPETALLLKRHNIHLVSLGNNHSFNFGISGMKETHSFLSSAGVAYVGGPVEDQAYLVEIKEIPFAFISYNQFAERGWKIEVDEAEKLIRQYTLTHIPIVFAHWGEEYLPATDNQKELARRFVDAGADVVVGAHPHIVQEYEIYKQVPIYYSLGNFVFDQYFNEEVTKGMMVKMLFSKDGFVSAEVTHTELTKDGRVCPRVL